MSIQRPFLSASGISARAYRDCCFERDLAVVLAAESGPRTRVSVASFCPDFPAVAMYAGPGRAFHSLPDSCWFLCAFFAAQLADQATHSVVGRVTRDRAGTGGNLVLVGLLASYWDVMEPAFLLLTLALYDAPFSVVDIVDGIKELISIEFAELRSHPSASRILAAARTSLVHIPDSLRAFVPHGEAYKWQPDAALVEALRTGAFEALSRPAV